MGLFVIGEPTSRMVKRKVMRRVLNIIEGNLKKIAFCDDKNGNDMMYVFTDQTKQNLLKELFIENELLISHKDLTRNYLYQIDIDPVFKQKEYEEILNEYLSRNLNTDTVLDKISDLGIKSLNKIDYKVLRK